MRSPGPAGCTQTLPSLQRPSPPCSARPGLPQTWRETSLWEQRSPVGKARVGGGRGCLLTLLPPTASSLPRRPLSSPTQQCSSFCETICTDSKARVTSALAPLGLWGKRGHSPTPGPHRDNIVLAEAQLVVVVPLEVQQGLGTAPVAA